MIAAPFRSTKMKLTTEKKAEKEEIVQGTSPNKKAELYWMGLMNEHNLHFYKYICVI